MPLRRSLSRPLHFRRWDAGSHPPILRPETQSKPRMPHTTWQAKELLSRASDVAPIERADLYVPENMALLHDSPRDPATTVTSTAVSLLQR